MSITTLKELEEVCTCDFQAEEVSMCVFCEEYFDFMCEEHEEKRQLRLQREQEF